MASAKLLMVASTMAYGYVFYTLVIKVSYIPNPTVAEDILIALSSIILSSIFLIHAVLGFDEEKTKPMQQGS
ncbi:hypothetical protein EHEL_041300 [Encephalitozoon hellem ATCC 50504]|uniref:uncharacterized protein n=1 Tax=Encephalitozoon hellem (strain ATCC 50504) TaxID=907965 RepID=UPI000269DB1D|nr:uncharacterized protein EHEL_041300 [Encephalitozoon hellem ATCC 50504]AFM98180.1 hypothetical protein EHEL_041300 [Encephalitozoon hellem ATCC 50504]|eukprot:XP_003887161.1 hypothetical protein EHEL_041300 [Encephalitozoon hellem ATCC 50504]